jgi:hypothetical protein
LIAVAIGAAPAQGASTRAEYVAQVDPICHAAELKGERLAKKHHLPRVIDLEDLRSGDRKSQLIVARQIALSNRKVVKPFIATVSTIPPPPGDEAIITEWIGAYRFFTRNADKAVRSIHKGKPRRAYHLFLATVSPILETGEALEPWGFRHCTA